MAMATMTSDADVAAFRANALEIVGSWSVHDDDDGHLFYYNLETSESRWLVPDEMRSLESEFMMKLMVDGAIARSGVWTAHDAGDGTLYYFNEKTRESVWEKPGQWGDEPVKHGNGHNNVPPPPPPPPPVAQKKPEPVAVKAKEPKKKKERKEKKNRKHKDDGDEGPLEAAPPTAEEVERLRIRAEQAKLSQEHFRAMLRDKKIMPFCKWSVAFPQIATDPRFLAIPTMDERREIFEDFVKNRRDDIKSEKKQKLKDAKMRFAKLLRQQFKQQRDRGSFDGKLTLSVFLATLEDSVPAEEYESLQQDVFAFLPMTVQEKVWEKEMGDYLEATKTEREQEAQLKAYLMEKLTGRGQYVSWHDAAVQDAVKGFTGKSLLSEAIQEAVVGQVAKAFSQKAAAEQVRTFAEPRPDHRPREHAPFEPAWPRGDHYGGGDRRARSRSAEQRRPRSSSRGRDHPDDEKRNSRREKHDHASHGHRRRSRSSSRSRSRSRGRSRHRGRDNSRRSRHDSRSSSRSRSGSRDSRDRSRSRRD